MNRELRRIQKKADEKKEKEKSKNKKKRLSKLQNKRQQRKNKIIKSTKSKSKPRFNTDRARFAVRMAEMFTLFTAFFIGVQVFVPTKQSNTFSPAITQTIEIAYYLFFGHFLMIWLLKRRVKYGLWYAIAAGVVLTGGLQLANYLINQNLNLQVLAFGTLASIAGSIMGQFFYSDLALQAENKAKTKTEDSNGQA